MGTPRLRPALAAIPAYRPGRPPSPGDGPAYKLSSNENPFPPLPGVLAAATEAARKMNRYPDMGVSRLHAAVAARFEVPISQVASGAGSVAVLYHLLQATCEAGDEVVFAWRSFEAYPIAVGLTGARAVQVPLAAGSRHDLAGMLAAVGPATRVVLVCSPNNPTGPAVHHDQLVDFLDAVPDDVVVVLDEAYREFVTDPAAADCMRIARGRDNVVVLRTFSKAYGLAGLRVGIAVASPAVAQAIRKCSLPFGVSSVAQAAALASLDAEDELQERVQAVVKERSRLVDALRDQGWDVPDAQGNFCWLALGERSAAFAASCDARGVTVRAFQPEGVRVTVGEPAADDIVLDVARRWRANGG
ncbi:MAG TPA: histidinol-phosphate transaminase [Nocardioidaceae bacterium]|nr:histidinol-phosphate transaminase [Nocardioidaceae bacterium]